MAETGNKACKTFKKSQAMSFFLFLLFIVPLSALRINSPAILEVSLTSHEGRVLVLYSRTRNQPTTKIPGGATSSPYLVPAGGGTTVASTNREFLVAAHEVPGGGNPIGNRRGPGHGRGHGRG